MTDDNKAPAYLEEEDGYAQITLHSPARINGQDVTILRMREPNGTDIKLLSNPKMNAADKEFRLFANLLECTPEEVEGLTLRNLRRVQEAFTYFRGGPDAE